MGATRHGIALAVMLSLGVAGCDNAGKQSGQQSSEPKTDVNAWWKDDGKTATSQAGSGLTGSAKPGWAKLAAVDSQKAAAGAKLFDAKGCVSCHSIGKGKVVGPDLLGVTHRVEPEWLETFLKDPTPMLESDPYAKDLLTTYLVKMPNLNLSGDEIKALVEFMREHDAKAAKG